MAKEGSLGINSFLTPNSHIPHRTVVLKLKWHLLKLFIYFSRWVYSSWANSLVFQMCLVFVSKMNRAKWVVLREMWRKGLRKQWPKCSALCSQTLYTQKWKKEITTYPPVILMLSHLLFSFQTTRIRHLNDEGNFKLKTNPKQKNTLLWLKAAPPITSDVSTILNTGCTCFTFSLDSIDWIPGL